MRRFYGDMHRAHSLSVVLVVTCCVSAACREVARTPKPASTSSARSGVDGAIPQGMVRIPAGTFRKGTLDGPAHETPVHEVEIKSFLMDRTEVTVGDFGAFVEATGYRTEAESIGWSGVFDPEQRRWGPVKGATWRYPDGPDHPAASASEPVTQVSWSDALAYAKWSGRPSDRGGVGVRGARRRRSVAVCLGA